MLTRRFVMQGGLAAGLVLGTTARVMAQSAGALDASTLKLKPGSPDNQSEILEKALATATQQRRALFVPAGTYKIAQVKVPDGATLVGAGMGRTRFVGANAAPLFVAENSAAIGFYHLALDGENRVLANGGALLACQNVNAVVIEECRIAGSGGHGIAFEVCGGRITECRIEGARFAGVFARDSRKLSITDNVIHDCANNGILVWRSAAGDDGTLVQGNRIDNIRSDSGGSGQNGNAINIFRAGGVVVSNNVIRRCAFSAVRANSTENVQILGNSIREMGEMAIFVEFGFSGAVVSNNMIDRAGSGISMTNFNEGGRLAVCSGNLVRDVFRRPDPETGVEAYGIGISAEADAAVTGNVIETAAFAGINLGYGPYLRDVSATGNLIRDAQVGIAVTVVQGAGMAVIRSNTVANATRGAVVGYTWDTPASGDLVTEGTRAFPNVTLSDTTVI